MWIETKLGRIHITLTGQGHVYATTYPLGTNTEDASPLVVRKKQHHISMHVYLNETRTTTQQYSDLYFATVTGGEGTSFQRKTIYETIREAVIAWVAEHPEVLEAAERRETQRQVEKLELELRELQVKEFLVQKELERLKDSLRPWAITIVLEPSGITFDWAWIQEHMKKEPT